MKIIHTVESFLPATHGMSEVVRQISEHLVKLGHDVTVCTSYSEERDFEVLNGVKIIEFKISGNLVNGITGEKQLYLNYLLEEDYDILTNFAAQQWATDICLEILPRLNAKKIFIPTGFSGIHDYKYRDYFECMKSWMLNYDMNVFLSENYRDINFAKDNNIIKRMLIYNGASYNEFSNKSTFNIRQYLGISPEAKIILHVGSYTSMKGHDEALKIFITSKSPDTHLIFVGKNFKKVDSINLQVSTNFFRGFYFKKFYNRSMLKSFIKYLIFLIKKGNRSVHLLDLNRTELIATFQQADLFLFPSLIECSPVVLFEAMASKTPFLVTDVGNSSEIIEWSKSGILLPTDIDENGFSHARIKESAYIFDNTISDKNLLAKLANNGYNIWLSKFTWEKISLMYETLYKQLLYDK